MVRSRLLTIVIVVAAAIGTSAAQAPAPQNPNIDAKAAAELKKMSAYLKTLSAFRIQAATTDEDVLEDGQKIQYSESVDILVSTPSHLVAAVTGNRRERILYFDGKTLTLYAPRVNYYASIGAPGTIAQLAKTLNSEYDLKIPLGDLFLWGSEGWNSGGVESVMDVGPGPVNGTSCEQYALRQGDIDWQIWIQLGGYPLPRKIVISNRADEERPEHTVVYTWDLAPSFNDAAFSFTPPPGAHRVPLAKASLAASQTATNPTATRK